jgi:hypothetical protein
LEKPGSLDKTVNVIIRKQPPDAGLFKGVFEALLEQGAGHSCGGMDSDLKIRCIAWME